MQRLGRNQILFMEQLRVVEAVCGERKWFLKEEFPYVLHRELNALMIKGFLEAKTVKVTIPTFQRPGPGKKLPPHIFDKRYFRRILDWPIEEDAPHVEVETSPWDPSLIESGVW